MLKMRSTNRDQVSSSPSFSTESFVEFKPYLINFFLLYFLQGLPFGFQTKFLPIYLHLDGMSFMQISFIKFLVVPWAFKFLYAPFIDNYGTKRSWLAWSLVILGLLCVASSFVSPNNFLHLSISLFLFNVVTSINDIALDGFVMEATHSSHLALCNTAQIVGYKTGVLVSGGLFSFLTEQVSWSTIFLVMALFFAMGFVITAFFLPPSSSRSDTNVMFSRSALSQSHSSAYMWACTLKNMFQVKGTTWMFLFCILYKGGELSAISLFPMVLLDSKVSPHEVGFWTGIVSQLLSIAGSLLPALLKARIMLPLLNSFVNIRAFFISVMCVCLVLWSSFPLFSYYLSLFSLLWLSVVSGAITTCTFTIIMALTKTGPQHCQASHYTLMMTAEVLGKLLLSSAISGLADYVSYRNLFFAILILNGTVNVLLFYPAESVINF